MAAIPPLPARHAPQALPPIAAPSLENLVVTAPAPVPATADELIAYADQLVRDRSPRSPRKYGEKIQLGDEVIVNMLGFAKGELIPFSARQGLVVEVGQGAVLPWLDEELLECSVGDGFELPVTFGDDEPVESMRGVEASFLVDIVSASSVAVPDPQSPEFLQLLGPAASLDQAMDAVADQLEDERVTAAWDEARERVIDEIVGRTEVSLLPMLIDEEIRRTWQRLEEPFLKSRKFEEPELLEALAGWMMDEDTRIEASRRLRLGLALQAITTRDNIQFDAEALRLIADEARLRFGLTPKDLADGLKDPKVHPALTSLGLHLRALQTVLAAASVKFEGMEGVFPFRA